MTSSERWSTILVERADHVMTVTLNRPERRNAFDWAMRGELTELWGATLHDRDVRCVVLTGAGEGFCGGIDVGDLDDERRPAGDGLDDEIAFVPGRRLDVPVVVAVNGVCAGGGLHFVADADIAIASDRAWFTDPHVNVGQVTGIEPVSLALRVPLGAIYRLALLGRGERWDAARALELGLVSEVMPPEQLLPRAFELAAAIAASSPAAVRASRDVLRRFETALLGPWMAEGWDAVQQHWPHPDSVEGPRAFSERREPVWDES
jgi:enoyl-CoA hydratase/carnithine racemase